MFVHNSTRAIIMTRMRILIVNSDNIELSLMAAALADGYAVITARNMKEALFFLNRFPPCRLTCFEVNSDVHTAVNNMRKLRKIGMEVIALFRPPCPKLVHEEIKSGNIQGLCKLPINIRAFTTSIRKFSARLYLKDSPLRHSNILTKEEISFILDFPHNSRQGMVK